MVPWHSFRAEMKGSRLAAVRASHTALAARRSLVREAWNPALPSS